MPINRWMIYGAYGYSGRLIAELAKEKGLKPVLAGRNPDKTRSLAEELGCEYRVFDLGTPALIASALEGIDAVVHCAGPFSGTSAPMIQGCLTTKTHYFDISGEIAVFEHAHSEAINRAAKSAGILVCPGIGFDVVPTDCLAKFLVDELPDATELQLGFAADAILSPGTAKSVVEGLSKGIFARRNGQIVNVPLAVRTIDYGLGLQQFMNVSWGDVSTAYHSTGIPNITLFWPGDDQAVTKARRAAWLRPLLRIKAVQSFLKKQVGKRVQGPGKDQRDNSPVQVWGEVRNASGKTVIARVTTANGYTVTQQAPVAIIEHLLAHEVPAGSLTPSALMGKAFISELPDSSEITLL